MTNQITDTMPQYGSSESQSETSEVLQTLEIYKAYKERAATISPAHPPPSRFLQLPAELRNVIYNYALAPTLVTMTISPTKNYPPLLHTNRQIRVEAASIYFDQNCHLFVEGALTPKNLAIFRTKAGPHINLLKKAKVLKRKQSTERAGDGTLQTISDPLRQYARFEVHHIGDRLEIKLRPGEHCDGNFHPYVGVQGQVVRKKGAFMCRDLEKTCYCRIRRLAMNFGGDEDSVMGFLEAWSRLKADVRRL